MCDCFHLAFPNWHAASSGTGGGRRLRGPESTTEDDSVCDEPPGFTEGERPRPQGSSPVDECPESEKFDSDEEGKAEHDSHHKTGSGKKTKKSGLGSMFEKRSTPKMSKLKEAHSPESEVIVKTAKDGCAEGLVYSGGGKDGIYIKEVVPESPASKSLKLKEGDQILSATVYFDNVPYEDAIQILEHAQAYKMKLCLKRKPDITQTDTATESNVIPEGEELKSPEMRKTKRRGDARISWPKFPSLGRGRKNRFTRSHSSSEAEEQRKLELSPTTSDTESPIKSQDALKGKKKHKMKLSVLTKRGRISSSEGQDTDAGTSAQISSDVQQTQESDMLSPEYLEESPQVFVTEHLKLMDDVKIEQNNELQKEAHSPQHKVELISIDSTLKTTDLTVALADPESTSGIKSPDGKKNKKERSELKIKILGKDKSNKKTKSPKRLKTLGASLEVADGPESQKSEAITSQEVPAKLLGDQTLEEKYPHKEKTKKSKNIKKFKLPRFGSSETPTEEIIKKSNDDDFTVNENRQLSNETTEDPYDKLSKMTQLPKREEIEIPGMEDMSKTKAQELKKPKAGCTGENYEIQSETVQLSIDVDSVKEAVSKLPGYKLPKVDTSGVPIPEEITVIDANAQRISVKTPTKVVESRTKHETHFTKFGTTGHSENIQPSFKLPKMRSVDLTTDALLFETKEQKLIQRDNKGPAYERENIILPGHQHSHAFDHRGDGIQGQKTIFLQDERISNIQMGKEAKQVGKLVSDVKMPEIEGIDFIDSAEITPTIKDHGIQHMDYDVSLVTHPKTRDVRSKPEGVLSEWEEDDTIDKSEIKGHERHSYRSEKEASQDKTLKVEMPEMEIKPLEFKREIDVQYKLPRVGIQISKIESPTMDTSLTKKYGVVELADITLLDGNVSIPEQQIDKEKPEMTIKPIQMEGKVEKEAEGPSCKFQIPTFNLPKLEVGTFSAKTSEERKHDKVNGADNEVPEDRSTVTIAAHSINVVGPSIQTRTAETEQDEKGRKFKMPNLGFSIPKVKESKIDVSIPKKDTDAQSLGGKTEMKLPKVDLGEVPGVKLKGSQAESKTDAQQQDINILKPNDQAKEKMSEVKLKLSKAEGELEGKGGKLGITVPNVDLNSSKKEVDATLPEAKAKENDFQLTKSSAEDDIKAPVFKVVPKDTKESALKFKIPKFKLPKFGVDPHTISPQGELFTVDIEAPSCKIKSPPISTNNKEIVDEVKEKNYKLSSLGFKGPEVDLSISKMDVDVTLPKLKEELSNAKQKEPVKLEFKAPELKVETKDSKEPPLNIQMETIKLPKSGIDTSRAMTEVTDKDEANISEVFTIDIKTPIIGTDVPSIDLKMKACEEERQRSKLKIPSPVFKESEDGKLKKDVDVTYPGAKVEAEISDSAKVDVNIKPFDCEAESLSKFKMPKLKIPKFGIYTQSLDAEKLDIDEDIQLDGVDKTVPGEVLKVNVETPTIDTKVSSKDAKMKDIEQEQSSTKFKLPSLGFKGPDVDLSKTNVEVKLPETKVEPSAEVELKAPEIALQTSDVEQSPSKFKLPTFRLPKFGATSPQVGVEEPDMDKNIEMKGADGKLEGAKVEVKLPEFEVKGPSTSVSLSEGDAKSKKPGWTMPSFSFSKASAKAPEAEIVLEAPKTDLTLPEAKTEVNLNIKEDLSVSKEDGTAPDFDAKFKKPRFSLPKISFSKPNIKASEVDVDVPQVDVSLPEVNVEVKQPDFESNQPESKIQVDGQDKMFKLPSLGFKEPDIDLTKPTIDVELPEAKVEVELPDVGLKKTSTEIKSPEIKLSTKDTDGSPSRFKLPTFKMPKFGIGTQNLEAEIPAMDTDIKVNDADITVPEESEEVLTVNIETPVVDPNISSSHIKTKGAEHEKRGSKFKLPSLGFKGPKIDLSKTDVEVKLQEAKVEVEPPNVELRKTSTEIKSPEIKVSTNFTDGSLSTFKMPTFKIPKFGIRTNSLEAEYPDMDTDIKVIDADITVPEESLSVDIKAPTFETKDVSIDAKTIDIEYEKTGSKFKLPSLGFKGPDIDLSKTDVDVKLPETTVEVELPDVELKKTSTEIKSPESKVFTNDMDGSPSRFKMPTFKLPKFGVRTKSQEAEIPDMDTDIKVNDAVFPVPEEVLNVNIESSTFDTKVVSIDAKTKDLEHGKQGSKFKLPSFGFKGPDVDLSKADADVKLPEANVEVELPNIELMKTSTEIKSPEIKVSTNYTDGSLSTFKMPTFKIPKFGIRTNSLEAEYPDMDTDIKVIDTDITVPEESLSVDIKAPTFETKDVSIDAKTIDIEHEKRGSKFKLPSLGFKGPKIDLSKTDVDVKPPKTTVEVELPDVELKKKSSEIKSPEAKVSTNDTDGSPSRFKMPTFKLPKFGVRTKSQEAEIPDMDTDIKVNDAVFPVPEEVLNVNIESSTFDTKVVSIDAKTKDLEHGKQGSKFKLPSFGFKGPDVDLSKADVDVKLPEANVEVELPNIELMKTSTEIKSPEIKVSTNYTDGSLSTFKMPTFKIPKFGIRTNSLEAEYPDMDTDIKVIDADITVPEESLSVDIKAPTFETKDVSIDAKTIDIEHEKRGSKFKLPSLAFKGPKIDLSKTDVDVKPLETTVEVELPDVELKKKSTEIKSPEITVSTKDKDGSPSRFKMPTFKLPKFGVRTKSLEAEIPDMDPDNKVIHADITVPEESLSVDIKAQTFETKDVSIDAKTIGIEQEKTGSKFKLPSLGFKGPDIDLSKTDVDVKLPETRVAVEFPDVELKKTSTEIKSPEIKVSTNETDGSPSRFKMPTFKLPKFGIRTKSLEAEVPDMDTDIKVNGAEITVPEEALNVNIEAPTFETKVVSIDSKTKDIEHEKRGSKFKLPSLGFKGPDVDLSKTQIDVKLPEAKVEVELPDVELGKPSAEVEIKSPEVALHTSDVEGSPSKFKLPTFRLPKFGATSPQVSVEEPDMDKNIEMKGADGKLEGAKVEVKLPEFEVKGPSTSVSLSEGDAKSKKPGWTMPSFSFSKASAKAPEAEIVLEAPITDLTLPEAKTEVNLNIKEDLSVSKEDETTPDQDAKFKRPRFSLPKISFSKPNIKASEVDVDIPKIDVSLPGVNVEVKQPDFASNQPESKIQVDGQDKKFKLPSLGFKGPDVDYSTPDIDVELPEAKVEVDLPDIELKKTSSEIKSPEIKLSTKDTDGSPSRFKLPTFKMPKFGVRTKSLEAEIPAMDTDIKVDGAQITVPEEVLTVNIETPIVEPKISSADYKTKGDDRERGGRKFKLPSLGFKGPDINLSKTDVDVKLPETTVEVDLPDVELKNTSTEIKSHEINVSTNETDGSPSKFKMPTFKLPKFGVRTKSLEAEIPDMDTDIKIIHADITVPEESLNVKIEAPTIDTKVVSIDAKTKDIEHEKRGSKFKLPSLGFKGPDVDLSKTQVDVKLPEAKVEVELPDVELGKPSAEVEIKSPEVVLHTSDVEGSSSKFKLPTFRLPKFGATSPQVSVEEPDMDKNIEMKGADGKLEGAKVEVKLPEFEVKGPSTSVSLSEGDAKSKKPGWSMPSFSFSKASAKAPEAEIVLEAPKTDLTLPEAKTEINLNIKEDLCVSKEDGTAPDFDAKFKKPRFSLPKISFSKPNIKASEVDVEFPQVDVSLPEVNVEVKQPDFESNQPESKIQVDGQDKMFKLPSLGFKEPDIDLTKSTIDVELPEAKVEVELPDVGLKKTSTEIKSPEIKLSTKDTDGSPSRFKLPTFKMPKFGVRTKSLEAEIPAMDTDIKVDGAQITVPEDVLTVNIETPVVDPKISSTDIKTKGAEHERGGRKFKLPSLGFKGPDIDLSKTDVDVKLPKTTVEVELPDVELKKTSTEITSPEINISTNEPDGSPSRFKMPTFKLPKFGVRTKSLEAEIPDMDTDIKVIHADITVPEESLYVNIEAPTFETKVVSIDSKTKDIEHEKRGSKFKLPSLGFKGPDVDISKTQIDVKLPEAKVEVELPDVELGKPSAEVEMKSPEVVLHTSDVDGSSSKFKLPTFGLPKFGVTSPQFNVEEPDMDKNIEIKEADVKLEKAKVEVKLPEFEVKGPSTSVSLSEGDAKSKKPGWTMPSFSFSKASAKAPEAEIVLEAPKTDLTLPEAKTEINLDIKEDLSVSKDDGTALDSEVKFKKPRFSLPKFSFSKPNIKASEVDVGLPQVDVSLPEVNVEVKQPDLESNQPESKIQVDGQDKIFTFPSLGFKEPDIDLTKPNIDVELPEAKVEVELPDIGLKKTSTEIKSPEIKLSTKDTDGSQSRFKLPTFKMPTFGDGTQNLEAEIPAMDTDIKVDGAHITVPEEVLTVNIETPVVDPNLSSTDIKTKGAEHERKGMKFKLPSLGFKGPDVDLSKTDVDVKLPKTTVEVELPDVELKKTSTEITSPEIKFSTNDTDGSPSRFKMPTFKLPKFGVRTKSLEAEIPDMDPDNKANGADITIHEGVLNVNIEAPTFETKVASLEEKTKDSEHEKRGSKFKLPSLGFKGPNVDLSTKNVDVKVPEAKVEVELPDVELGKPSAEVEIKSPEVVLHTSDVEGSPSKFKLPTFGLPKFGATSPQVSGEVPDIDKNIEIKGADVKLEGAKVEVKLPEFEVKGPSTSVSLSEGDAKSKKPGWTMPSFSFSKASAKAPEAEIILEAPKTDLTLPEAKTEINLNIKEDLSVSKEDGTAPDFDAKFKKPRFSLPKISFSKPNIKASEVDVDVPQVDVSLQGVNVEVKQPDFEFDYPEDEIKVDTQVKKFKLPKFVYKGPDLDIPNADVVVKLPEKKVSVEVPDVDVKDSSTEIKSTEIKLSTKDTERSPSKFKLPTFKMPKFGVGTQSVESEVPDVERDIKIDGADITVPEEGLTVITEAVDAAVPSIDVKMKESKQGRSGTKVQLPSLGFDGLDVDVISSGDKAEVQILEVEMIKPSSEVEIKGLEVRLSAADVKFPQSEIQESEETAVSKLPKIEVKGGEATATEPDSLTGAKGKRPSWTFPKFSFSKTSEKSPNAAMNTETTKLDDTLSDANIQAYQQDSEKIETETKLSEIEMGHEKGATFKLPKISVGKRKLSEKGVDFTGPAVEAEVNLPRSDVKEELSNTETVKTESKSKEVRGSPLKFKMPTLKMPQFSSAAHEDTTEATSTEKDPKTDKMTPKEEVTVTNKEQNVETRTDLLKEEISEIKMPKDVLDGVSPGSPSKFSLSLFKMPKLGFSRAKSGDEHVLADSEEKRDPLEVHIQPKEESKSPKSSSFGKMFDTVDVDFDVPKVEKVEDGKELDGNVEPPKSPEKTGWFRFPKLSQSSPTEAVKPTEKTQQKETSSAGETGDEEISPISSVESSDAFADVSSTVTSEPGVPSLSSPTKVTAKYTDQASGATSNEEMTSNIISSTARSELFSEVPTLPEKITILSSGASSSSEDTLRLKSSRIHVISSNIQATPEAERARLLTAVQIQSAEGLPQTSDVAWRVEDSEGNEKMVFEKHVLTKTSEERSESKETIVITKQITRVFESSDAASSIQRLRDSVHSEKMKFFDEAEK